MGKLKKIMIGLGICLLLVLLLGSCSYLFARPMYYRLFYPWDRVTGTVQVELDGESVPFTVEKLDGKTPVYVVEGPKIEKMLGYTNLETEKGFAFFQKFLDDNGISDRLREMGIQDGDTVRLYGHTFEFCE